MSIESETNLPINVTFLTRLQEDFAYCSKGSFEGTEKEQQRWRRFGYNSWFASTEARLWVNHAHFIPAMCEARKDVLADFGITEETVGDEEPAKIDDRFDPMLKSYAKCGLILSRRPFADYEALFNHKGYAALRHARNVRKPKPKKQVIADKIGTELPDNLRDVFADTSLIELIDEINAWQAGGKFTSWAEKIKRISTDYSFLMVGDLCSSLQQLDQDITAAIGMLESGVPFAVAPCCDGKGCRSCRMKGYLPEWKFKEVAK